MSSAVFFSLLAMVLYATEIFVADFKLAKVSPMVLTFYYSLGVMTCAALSLMLTRQEQVVPSGASWIFIVLMILCSFGAAYAHFSALYSNSGAVRLTTFYMFLPVVAALLAVIFKQELPSAKILLAWVLGSVALYLASSES